MARQKLPPFDPYYYYLESVQDPPVSADFIANAYYKQNRKWPLRLREDFCGAFALCHEWVQRDPKAKAIGIDKSMEPIRYGGKHYVPTLTDDQQSRLTILNGDVLKSKLPKAEVIAALNFSFFCFKKKEQLVHYFRRCHQTLEKNGILVLDCFGGPETHGANEDVSRVRNFTYYWDQVSFDPITHHALFHIHFKRKNERKRLKVFTYDWRMWTIPEITDALQDAGFKKSVVYWEGTKRDGTGTGHYRPATSTKEECNAWVVYIVGVR